MDEKIRVENVEIYQLGGTNESFNSIITDPERDSGFVEFYDIEVEDEHCYFANDALVHNCHHVSNPFSGMYFEALARIKAPCRFGFTATESDSVEARFGLEGLIGPIIGELTMSEGQDLGFLANAEILFRLCPLPDETMDMKRSEAYSKIYRSGIVKNFGRCGRIAGDFELEVKRGGIVLILVTQIDHIYELLEFISIPVAIVKGSVSKEERFEIKEGLKAGRLKGVIATVAWTEGIDIPNLTMVINAAGGKSERLTLQKIGRGLRRTETKTQVKLIDYMDVGHYGKNILSSGTNTHILHKQSIKRWKTYEEQGWKPKLTEHL